MTTIAFDGVMLSGDTQVTCNGVKSKVRTKIYKCKHFLMGFAGSLKDGLECYEVVKEMTLEEAKAARFGTKKGTDIEIIAVAINRGKSKIYNSIGGGTFEVIEREFAIGSGSQFALAAMKAGADSYKAVKIASDLDIYTGGKIVNMKV